MFTWGVWDLPEVEKFWIARRVMSRRRAGVKLDCMCLMWMKDAAKCSLQVSIHTHIFLPFSKTLWVSGITSREKSRSSRHLLDVGKSLWIAWHVTIFCILKCRSVQCTCSTDCRYAANILQWYCRRTWVCSPGSNSAYSQWKVKSCRSYS